jgi:tetratricopeptide (TPR) repeat protein
MSSSESEEKIQDNATVTAPDVFAGTAEPPPAPSTPPPPVKHAITLQQQQSPSMTLALFVYWILPLLLIAAFSRRVADTDLPVIVVDPTPAPSSAALSRSSSSNRRNKKLSKAAPDFATTSSLQQASPQPRDDIVLPSSWPTAYQDAVKTIYKRRRKIPGFAGAISSELEFVFSNSNKDGLDSQQNQRKGDNPTASPSNTNNNSNHRGRSSHDPIRIQFHEKIDQLVADHRRHPHDIFRAIAAADAMRFYDLQFHEGGTYELQALDLYDEVIAMGKKQREAAIAKGEATNRCVSGELDTVNDEVLLDYMYKSIDGLLCGIYTAKGKAYFMANMFERAVQSYDQCLNDIDPSYLDARSSRASSLIVLGKYAEAASDYLQVIHRDSRRLFIDAFTGLARILEVKEDSVPDGWNSVLDSIENLVATFEQQLSIQPSAKQSIANGLNRLHHVLFTYHDVKTKNYATAFEHLQKSFNHKLSVLEPWNKGSELAKIQQTKAVFSTGFWSGGGMGSQTSVPIFIVGFVRSGSTLLERILDAHPLSMYSFVSFVALAIVRNVSVFSQLDLSLQRRSRGNGRKLSLQWPIE